MAETQFCVSEHNERVSAIRTASGEGGPVCWGRAGAGTVQSRKVLFQTWAPFRHVLWLFDKERASDAETNSPTR